MLLAGLDNIEGIDSYILSASFSLSLSLRLNLCESTICLNTLASSSIIDV